MSIRSNQSLKNLHSISEVTGGNIGLALTQILSLISLSQWGVRQTAEVENNMTSVERIMEYVNLEPEEDPTQKLCEIPGQWPKNGSIEFIDVSLKYSEAGDYMLKSLNVTIKPGEKVAICGRTGAGKSSIVRAIFRMACDEGVIKIDSVDISTIPLSDLRKNISIIPQDAILFSGSMRQNLDPFSQYSDDELWAALEKVRILWNHLSISCINSVICLIYSFRSSSRTPFVLYQTA